jgi:hypothetical protein
VGVGTILFVGAATVLAKLGGQRAATSAMPVRQLKRKEKLGM